jgi:N-carbamoyl-L-amino-acid hydrolase
MTELHDLIAIFAAIGSTGDGGVCRLTATPSDKEARDLFLREMSNRGLLPRIDAIGNMFGVAVLAPASKDVVITGSHLDSQPTGGRYDGVYGVLAGLLAVKTVRDRAVANPGKARRNLAVANWTNEEGARFQPSLTGSSVFAGSLPLERAMPARTVTALSLVRLSPRLAIAARLRRNSNRCAMSSSMSSRATSWNARRRISRRLQEPG